MNAQKVEDESRFLLGQQMRGDCSPLSMSTIRVVPILLFSLTMPEHPSFTMPTARARMPSGWERLKASARSAAA